MLPPTGLSDTSRDASALLVRLAREKTPAEKAAIAAAMSRAVRGLAEAGIRSRHPHADEDGVRRRLAANMLPRTLAIAVFGWDPVRDGF